MPSWQARVATFITRHRVRPALGDLSDISRVRRVFNQRLPAPRGVRYTAAVLGGVPGEWVQAEVDAIRADNATDTPPLLYLHGGGFVGCSPRRHRSLTAA
ncbi:MAG: alpha/beta hydrolase, partial [Burkholderiales bacterium PBB5]